LAIGKGQAMRAAMRLAWRAAGIAAFGATAALAVVLSSHAPMRASLISASGPGGGHGHGHARTSAAGRCTDAAIDVWVGVGAARAGRVDLEFTNISHSACELRGYPGVATGAAGAARQAIKPARRSPATVSAVIVRPGETAHAVADLAPGGCRAAGGLRVGLPADRSTPYTLRLCSAPLRVGPIEPGMGIPET
jgi:hypothetical protein